MRTKSASVLGLGLLVAGAWVLAGCTAPTDRASDLLQGVEVVPWGHTELAHLDETVLAPLVLDEDPRFGICLSAPAGVDTSQWTARLQFASYKESAAPFAEPKLSWGSKLCFDVPVPVEIPDGIVQVCPTIRDSFDGRQESLPCLSIVRRHADPAYVRLQGEMGNALQTRTTLATGPFVDSLIALADRALREDYAVLYLRLRLIATFYLRQTGVATDRERALALFGEEPAWLGSPAATPWAALVHYELASLDMEPGGNRERAWRHLQEAARRYESVLDPKRFTAAMKQADILSGAGGNQEAIRRLGTSLESCDRVPCDARLLPAARNSYGWLLLLDTDADAATLDESVGLFRTAIAAEGQADAATRANFRINLAYALLRTGADPRPQLDDARSLLRDGVQAGNARAKWLAAWADWIEARRDLREGQPADALRRCTKLAESSTALRLRAWSYSCVATARRDLGDLDGAAWAIERALVHHELRDESSLGQNLFLGPGQRADDFYRAARIEVERAKPAAAWSILDRLDRNLAPRRSTEECQRLRASSEPQRAEWLDQLDSLSTPVSGARRQQREIIRRSLLDRLQELVRTEATCVGVPDDLGSDAMYRAIPLEDEILVLRRHPTGVVGTYRRTPIPRREVLEAIQVLQGGMQDRQSPGSDWNAALRRLSRAIAPDPADLGEVTSFTLHGVLQSIPLSVLPIADGPASKPMTHYTSVTLRPAGSLSRDRTSDRLVTNAIEHPVFVVNPTGTLRTRADSLTYLRGFARAEILDGHAATPSALRRALKDAELLHIDSHAIYDAAYPELSRIQLSGGSWSGDEFRSWAGHLHAANLSACRSGLWPATADSGRFGLAGALNRAGVPWVIGARTDLDDAFALVFNEAFYEALAGGAEIPGAFRTALERTRGRFSETIWSALFLLSMDDFSGKSGAIENSDPLRGQTPRLWTPQGAEAESQIRNVSENSNNE